MKRVAFSLLMFPHDNIAGIGYWCRSFISHITDEFLKIYDIDITFFTTGDYDAKKLFLIGDSQRIHIIYIKNLSNYAKRILFETCIFSRYLNRFDIFFNPAPLYMIYRPKCKIVTIIHDMIPFLPKKLDRLPLLRKFWRQENAKWSIKYSNKILTISYNSKNDILKRFKINHEKIKVFYMFIDFSDFLQQGLSLSSGMEQYFVICSTLQKGKNIEGMMAAFQKYCNDKSDNTTKLYILGKEGFFVNAIKTSVPSDIKHRIIFTGYLSENEKINYISNAIALLYCSFYEGFGIPPLEAMNLGVPSIVSNTSSLPEVVGDAGITVDPYDISAIAQAMYDIQNIQLRQKLISNMELQLKKFDSQQQVKKILDYLTML